jgi:hypothetical protein
MGINPVRELFTNTKNNYNLLIKMIANAINKMTVWNKSYIFTDKFWISLSSLMLELPGWRSGQTIDHDFVVLTVCAESR